MIVLSFFILIRLIYLDSLVFFSFLLNFIIITYHLWRILRTQRIQIFDVNVFSFTYIFLFLAPIFQTLNYRYPNTMTFDFVNISKTNLLVLLFLVSYHISYRFFVDKKNGFSVVKTVSMLNFNYRVFWIMEMINIVVFVLTFQLVYRSIFIGTDFNLGSQALELLTKKFVFMFPFFTTSYLIFYGRKGLLRISKMAFYFLLTLNLFLLFWLKNPFIENRNALGAIALSLITLILIKYFKKTSVNFILMLIGLFALLILFPLAKITTHYAANISSVNVTQAINFLKPSENFNSLDFDAWSNIMSTIGYVKERGLTYGKQLLGTLLFFIPRSIWSSKPEGTGGLVAVYVMTKYTMWFKNISNPIISEGYIDFHIFGVVLYALMLSLISWITSIWIYRNDFRIIIAVFLSSNVFYIMRGDLISSFAYTVAGIIAIYVLPLLITILISGSTYAFRVNRMKERKTGH